MNLRVCDRYLVLPVSYHAQSKNLSFFSDGRCVYDIDVNLDPIQPDTYQYLDLRHFLGQTLDIVVQPEMELSLSLTESPPKESLYHEKYRPQCHFSSERGWINDPNGLLWYQGKYHMFFQHNPAGSNWGNMHWGHAVSTDLLRWRQKEIALFPDELGTIYSGSGFVDTRNASGLKNGPDDPILLFYTAAGSKSVLSAGQSFTQCLAYSIDGGKSFQKYVQNPIIPHIAGENRDPKVVYAPADDCYYLVLYLQDDAYALFISDDLLHWKQTQTIHLPGDDECPDLYPLRLNGNGEEYWIFSGASDRYLIGRLGGGRFEPCQPVQQLHFGNCSYAAQTFSHIPAADGRRLRIAWNQSSIPDSPFNGSMCTPLSMQLREINGERLLCAQPIRELASRYQHTDDMTNQKVVPGQCWSLPLSGKSQDITMKLSVGHSDSLTIALLGLALQIFPAENRIECKGSAMPAYIRHGELTLRLITDVASVEIYTDQGEAFMAIAHLCDYTLNRLSIAGQKDDITILSLSSSTLSNVWSDTN